MTPEQEIARRKKFDDVRKDIERPEYFQDAYLQILNELYYTMNINLDTLAQSLTGVKEALGTLQAPTGWRKEIYDIFKITILKKVRLDQAKPEDALWSYANDLGLLSSVKYAAEKLAAEWDSTDELLAKGLSPLSPKEFAALDSGNPEVEKLRKAPAEALANLIKDSPPSKQKDLVEEFGKGTKNLFADDLSSPYETTATYVYQALLFLGGYVKAFYTVEELHAFLWEYLPSGKMCGLIAFRKLCTRINLKTS